MCVCENWIVSTECLTLSQLWVFICWKPNATKFQKCHSWVWILSSNGQNSKIICNELSIRSPHTLPEIAGLRPLVFVSGWSLHPSWQFQCNRPHEGQRNKAVAYQQEWFHYRTIGQSLRHVRLSSTFWHRPSPYCGTMLVDREETVRSDKWIGIWWKSDSVRPTRSSTYLPTV